MKNRILHISFTSLATLILLLHAVTSHHHEDARIAAGDVVFSHECHDSVLIDLFGIDLGDHHLEEFQISSLSVSISPDFLVAVICELFFEDVFEIQSEDHFVAADEWNEDLIHLTAFSLRGPPAQMI